jgi:hypothetical protein
VKRIPLDPVERLMVELALVRENAARKDLNHALEKKNDTFRALIAKYNLQGVIGVSDDYAFLELPDDVPAPEPPSVVAVEEERPRAIAKKK